MIILGLIALIATVAVGVAGVVVNSGAAHALAGDFTVFGYQVTGSTGMLFAYGIVVGAAGAFGLSLLLAGSRRTARRGRQARRELAQTRDDAGPVAGAQRAPAEAGSGDAHTGSRSWRRPLGGHHAGTPAPG
ncbi:hypothetical protein R1X32_09950 (plasmid) [Rhodococcus opacus]|uniref:hypothetical protein n=1 Tax=Rhodococcus opacus TaxID=37919 RepID=UPI0034D17297